MAPDELLEQIAHSLRREIGPAVTDEFAKTQAFMASVVLEKVSRQLRLTKAHAGADAVDRVALVGDVEQLLGDAATPSVRVALASSASPDFGVDLSRLVAAVYSDRPELGADRFEAVLTRVRATLRARLDRQLEYAS